MKKKFIVLITIIAISLLVSVSAILFKNTGTNNSPPPNSEISCNALRENPGGINIVYFSTEKQAQEYTDYFLSTKPFSDHPDKFSFYFITPEEYAPECDLYQGIAILCHSRELVKVASNCPNDYIVVLESRASSIRSSAFRGVMSLNTNHPLTVYPHEFYHVFDNGAEEYVSPGAGIPRQSENCQRDCDDFREFPEHGKKFGCHEGCTKSNYFREFENGFMKSLHAESYGPHNILILNEEILNQFDSGNSITGLPILEQAQRQEFFIIEETESGFTKERVTGFIPGGKKFGTHTYEVKDSNGQTMQAEQTQQEYIHVTDFSEESIDITAPPTPNDQPIFITTSSTGQEESIEIKNPQGQTIVELDLKDTGARPCKT